MADGTQERISLETIRGEKGYRIVKFQLIAKDPGETEYEHIVQIWKEEQNAIVGTVDFSDNRLLAAAYLEGNRGEHYQDQQTVLFDQEIFNQDIYITHQDVKATPGVDCNYYFELEVFDLALDESTVATLKDIRNSE